MQQRCCASLVTACQQLARLKLQKLLSSNTMAKEMNFHQDCASARPSNLCQAAVAASKRIQTRQLPSHWQTTDRSVSQILQTQSKHQCRGHISASHNQSLLCKTPFRSLTCKSPSAAGSSSKLSATLGHRLCGQSGASMAAKHSGAPGTGFRRTYSLGASTGARHVGITPQVDAAALAKAHKLSVPVGVLAGVFGSFVGVGGGVLIVPMLTGACKGLPQRLVSGTSLVAVVSTAVASSYTYLSHGVVDTAAALIISCCAVLTAPIGANLTTTLNAQALKKILGVFLVAVALLVPLKSVLFQNRQNSLTPPDQPLPQPPPYPPAEGSAAFDMSHMHSIAMAGLKEMSWTTTVVLGLTGATAGVASGLLGIGGGTVVTPLLAIATPLSQAAVLGSSLLAMVAPSCVGLAQHARLSNVDWRLAAGLAAGTALGSFAGSKVAVNAPTGVLEGIFSVGMLFLGWHTLAGARQALQKATTKHIKA